MKYLIHLVFFMGLGCGKFVYSPYSAKGRDLDLNAENLKKIQKRETSFGTNFKVAVISDSHNYFVELDKIVELINKKKDEIAFVIITGDITNSGLKLEFEKSIDFFSKLSVPFIVTIGNHDYLSNGEELFKTYFGKDTFSFTFKQTKFILFDNNNWEAQDSVPDFDWVESQLSNSTSSHNLLFSHVSPVDTARYGLEAREKMEELVHNYSVAYYIHGHDHNPAEEDFGGGKRIVVGSPSKEVYLELSITNTGISHEKISF